MICQAANILRGPVDAADFKTYVFPLLFFKSISDVHDEEYAAALGERLEKIQERHEQGFFTSLEFLKAILELAREVVEVYRIYTRE